MKNEEDIIAEIQKDDWMMEILYIVQTLNLPDWWVCAGFVRSKIWDTQHHFSKRTPLPDIDVIYYDSVNAVEEEEKKWEGVLKSIAPKLPWSVKNQSRMHLKNQLPPYSSSIDGISKFPETATALGVKLGKEKNVVLAAPWGVEDVIKMEVRATPFYKSNLKRIYQDRVMKKNWQSIWSKVKIYDI
ncbi:nucleotidyltransferase family protein [Cytobacillus sp. Hz8]|uniref:nucleotidyltransferase family protein n=1 Tax=Cytobacillus sp. Hz8 TaxID=3347168 RepID=UPI0035D77B90